MNTRVSSLPLAVEHSLNNRQYRLWSEMLENRTGVQIARDREDFVRGQITRRLAELNVDDADTYLRGVLETVDGVREWGLLLDRLLVKETRFFRHQPSFDFLRRWMADRVAGGVASPLTLWSAGCSTGEEVYSLAIIADQVLADAGLRPAFGVIGTDISRGALEFARSAVYYRNVIRGGQLDDLAGYAEALDKYRFRIGDKLRRRVCFVADNMLSAEKVSFADKADVIFCHNVLIYFKRWRRRQVVTRLISHLKVGGCLVLGPGELSDWTPAHARREPAAATLAFIRTE